MEGKSREPPPAPANAEASAPPPAAQTLSEGPRRRAGAPKRKASGAGLSGSGAGASSAPSKRQAKDRNSSHFLPPAVHNGPCTRARQSPNKFAAAGFPQRPPEPAGAPMLAARGAGGVGSAAGGPIKAEDWEEELVEEPLVDAEFDVVRSRGAGVHAVPTPAGWFSWKRIHPLEKHGLPSFFSGKSENRTPEIYMEIRNAVMKKFHADPQTQLELKDLSELTVGDMDARQEVMEFLDHWGLINFHPFPPSKPDESNTDADSGVKTPSLVEKLFQFETVQPSSRFGPRKAELSAPPAPPSLLRESALADDMARPVGPSVEYHCNYCSADCSRKRYHCQKQADFDLCTNCYNDGKFGSGMAPTDFILMESAEVPGVSGGSWTDQETLLLLEALELFGENWNEITEHVATKTKTQCILHFLQMPIEDSFLEGEDDVNDKIPENINSSSIDKEHDSASPNKESAVLHVSDSKEVEKIGDTGQTPSCQPDKESAALPISETKEVENISDAGQTPSSPIDASNKKDANDNEISHETFASVAIDVLKTAFEAVGYLPEQGGLGSFADAGNPVMALASFLARLVDPAVATTSCRSSLKSVSEDSPGIQLATRHCFLLEDPPNDKQDSPSDRKDSSACVSAAVITGDEKSQKEQDQTSISDGTDKSNGCMDKNDENAVPMEKENKSSITTQECLKKLSDAKESCDVIPSPKAILNTNKDSSDQSVPGGQIVSSTLKDTSDSASPAVSPSNTKECEDLASQGEDELNKEKKLNELDLAGEEKPSTAMELDDLASVKEIQQNTDTSKSADSMAASVAVKEQESQQSAGTSLTAESREKTDEGDHKVSVINAEKNCISKETDHDHNIGRLKRAAVTALSAAAVKAKLLADQEEDQIRQLVSFIIEKQLHKIEAKLAVFTEIESVVTRMREQTDKARQRLLHERSQIIAARLGLPTSTFRANPPSLPTSRIAMGYSNLGLKLAHMASQKPPPVRRP